MEIVMKDIETIAWFKNKEYPTPIKIRLYDEDLGNIVIPIEIILFSEMEKYAGNKMILYRCKSIVNNMEKEFELKYEIDTYKWFLYRI